MAAIGLVFVLVSELVVVVVVGVIASVENFASSRFASECPCQDLFGSVAYHVLVVFEAVSAFVVVARSGSCGDFVVVAFVVIASSKLHLDFSVLAIVVLLNPLIARISVCGVERLLSHRYLGVHNAFSFSLVLALVLFLFRPLTYYRSHRIISLR